jgi:hypothetical protein
MKAADMNNYVQTLALAAIALAALIAGAVVSVSGTDASALWAIAGTAAGAIGGALMPGKSPALKGFPESP